MPKDTKRTFGLHIYSPAGKDYRIEVERETLRTYENGDTNRLDKRIVRRSLLDIAGQALPGGPVTINTIADLACVISACATTFADEDEKKALEEADAAAKRRAVIEAAAANNEVAPSP